MKQTFAAFALFAVATLGAVTHLSAQDRALSATVPFDFTVGDRLLPHGTYWITPAGTNRVLIKNKGGQAFAFALGSPNANSADRQGKLVFDKVGGQYFLNEIVSTSATISVVLPVSKVEKRAQIQRASVLSDLRTTGSME